MKKQLFLIMTMLAATTSFVSAQVTFNIDKVTLPQNSECDLPVSFHTDDDDSYSGWQMSIELPDGVEFVTNDNGSIAYTAGDCYDEAPMITPNLVDGVLNVGCFTANANPLTKREGTLVTFRIKASSDQIAIGERLSGKLSGARISTSSGVSKHLADCTFDIVVAAPIDTRTVLDENAVVAPDAALGVDVRVKRTIKAGEWSTICLPFAMTEAQVKKAFGDDVELGDFNDYEVDADYNIKVHFVDVTAIEANHPYIIKVGSDIAEFTADGVNIDPQEAVVDFDTSRRKNQPRQMVGVYEAGTVLGWGTLFLSGNLFWYSVGETKIKAFRAYFNFNDLLPDFEEKYEARSISMMFDDGVTTRLTNATQRIADGDAIYDLQGRRVINPGKGIYVSKGKKINMLKH